jgi:hypothetical protein
MKQYYEDGQVIVPFRYVEVVVTSESKVSVYTLGNENNAPLYILKPERFVEEYRAWLDGGDENARG